MKSSNQHWCCYGKIEKLGLPTTILGLNVEKMTKINQIINNKEKMALGTFKLVHDSENTAWRTLCAW